MGPSSISLLDAFLVVLSGGVVSLIFRRAEPCHPASLAFLLLAVPLALATLSNPPTSVKIFISTLFTYWLSLVASILVYRVSPWHPLSQYPGPILCKITKLYIGFISLRGRQHLHYKRLHEQYGDVVRIGPNELSFCDVDAVAPILGASGLPKGTYWEGRVPENQAVKPLIAIKDKQEHARRRRAWTRGLNTPSLKIYEEIIRKRCAQLAECLASASAKGAVDMTTWVSYFAYDTISDIAFGGGSEMLRDGDVEEIWHLLELSEQSATVMTHVPWLGAILLALPECAKSLKIFRAQSIRRAMARKQQGSPYKDLFYHLFDEGDVAPRKASIIDHEAINDSVLAILGGADTSSSAISNLFYFLLCKTKCYSRLQAEIDSLGNEGDVAGYSTIASLPYLNACLNECLRLLPPIMGGSVREVPKGSGGKMVGSYFIPEGTNVAIPPYTLQRDLRYFSPLPESFVPERWLPEDQRLALEPGVFAATPFILNTNAHIPFSFGPANCVGKNLAWLEMRLQICYILQRFDMKFETGYDPEKWFEDIRSYLVMVKGELPVILSPRTPPQQQ